MIDYLKQLLENMPSDWLRLTTHRLDIYDESQAKSQFISGLQGLYEKRDASLNSLSALPTAYDYIRLGHPLSSVLEWVLADKVGIQETDVIAFGSQTTPILAVLRKNLFAKKSTQIVYTHALPSSFDADVFRKVYGYSFDVVKVASKQDIPEFDGSTIFVCSEGELHDVTLDSNIDFLLKVDPRYGSILLVNGTENAAYVSEIQHVRRRETIAMTPADCNTVLRRMAGLEVVDFDTTKNASNAEQVTTWIKKITGSETTPQVGSSGLSIQYGIMMGLIHHAMNQHAGQPIKIIVPPNCYGGTNDQARRVAACLEHVEVLDLPVDAGRDMVDSVENVLTTVAEQNAVPIIIVEIPTNPRVEVPNLEKLEAALSKPRVNAQGESAVRPIFVLDQTFCPNYHFLGDTAILSKIQTIAYVSGSKFPSGGLCTAGYVTANSEASALMPSIDQHLTYCDNKATNLQMEILAMQLPSMNERIAKAYKNTREFVSFIHEKLPTAKINFVSEELAEQGFTPSVFSLDLPTKGETDEEREMYKRSLNLKLINMMIEAIPNESKYCVSYGQLKGCYWTIPATSTQGTTKEGDKDYIARVALSPDLDLEKHKEVFKQFVSEM